MFEFVELIEWNF